MSDRSHRSRTPRQGCSPIVFLTPVFSCLGMIDIVRFPVDMKVSWVKSLGFQKFVQAKEIGAALGGTEEKNLAAVRQRRPVVLLVDEVKEKDKLHYRSSGLTHQILQLASQHTTAFGFCFSTLLDKKGKDRALLLGRMMQNVQLCRKYKIRMVLCSFARNMYELKSASDLQSFGRLLGMTPLEAKKALNFSQAR